MVAMVTRDSIYAPTGTDDGLAKAPYIRESRRIRAEFTVTEMHVGQEARGTGQAANFPDSIGIGCYRIDLHPSTGKNNYIDISSLPFQIPLGALFQSGLRISSQLAKILARPILRMGVIGFTLSSGILVKRLDSSPLSV